MATLTDLRDILGTYRDFLTNDILTGSQDGDTISIHGGSDTVRAGAGNDLIFENRAYPSGDSGYDRVYAGSGDDIVVSVLDGGNEFYGEDGNDTFIANASNGAFIDLATHLARDRSINVNSYVDFENATGSMLNDYVYGNADRNVLHGNWGDDLLRGRDGADELYGDQGQDVVFGGNHSDRAFGGEGNDMLYGEGGNDGLFGENGNDFLIGGGGIDYMLGGAGRDTFRFQALTDSGITNTTVDTLGDFTHLQDRIDVSEIDARATAAGNQAFSFIGTAQFSAAGQIRYAVNLQSHDTYVYFNTDNDAAAEMVLRIDPVTALSAQDFIL